MARSADGVAGNRRTRRLFGGGALAVLMALGLMLAIGAGSAFASAPGPPTGVTAAATDGQAAVSFTAPTNDGGTAVSGYTVTAAPGGAHASGTASPITVTGLADGTAYTFTVTATNGTTSVASSPSASVTPLAVPSASVDPKITGTAEVDDMLTASTGTWSESSLTFAYQWSDCDVDGCTAIPDATGSTYTVDPLDGGENLEVSVAATNADGERATVTAQTAPVTAKPGAPVVETEPTIGAVDGAQTVYASPGLWTPASPQPTFVYEWYSCVPDLSSCDIAEGPSSTATAYTPTVGDSGNVLFVEVVATNGSGDSEAAFSATSAPVTFPPPTITVTYPVNGEDYSPELDGLAGFGCEPGAGTTLETCNVAGSTSLQYLVPFSIGAHSIVFTAEDSDGQSVTKIVNYTVGGAPLITTTAPVNGASYPEGSSLNAIFSCSTPFASGGYVICTAKQSPACPVGAPEPSLCPASLIPGAFLDTTNPGQHTVTISATDGWNETATATLTYTVVASPASTPPAVNPAPRATIAVTGLAQSRSTWRLGTALPSVASVKRPPVGTAFSFNSNMAAQVTFAFSRQESGRKHGGRCVAETAANAPQHACTRSVGAGSFTVAGSSGENTVRFDGRVSASRKLAPGSYAVAVTATGSGSSVGVGTLHFTIVG